MPARVVVIGAGVVGAAVAAELSRLGAAVIVVDQGKPAGGTSGATFSWVNSNNKRPRPYHELNVAGMLAHRRFADQMGADQMDAADWYHGGGNLEWRDTADGQAKLAEKVDRLRADHYPVRWLDRAEVRRLEPDMAAHQVPDDGIAFYPEEGWVEPTRLVTMLLSLARQAGATVITGDPVAEISVAGDAVGAVAMGSGESIPVDAVVDCAGPNADAVAAMAGLELPMRNTTGVLAYLQPVAVAIRRVVHAPQVHLRPDGGGRLLLHSEQMDNAAAQDGHGAWSVPPQATGALIDEAGRLYPGIAGAAVEAVRVGVRPIPADGLPVLGRSTTLGNFHFGVTHSGATLCLRIAELLAPEVLGRAESPELDSFRQARLLPSAESGAAPGAR